MIAQDDLYKVELFSLEIIYTLRMDPIHVATNSTHIKLVGKQDYLSQTCHGLLTQHSRGKVEGLTPLVPERSTLIYFCYTVKSILGMKFIRTAIRYLYCVTGPGLLSIMS